MLSHAEPHLDRNIHPTVICRALMKALDDAVELVEKLAFKIDFMDRDALMKVVDSCIATKFTRRFGTLIPVLFLASFFISLDNAPVPSIGNHRKLHSTTFSSRLFSASCYLRPAEAACNNCISALSRARVVQHPSCVCRS